MISLAGTWQFRLDPDGVGIERQWFRETLDDAILLPGTTDEGRKGMRNTRKALRTVITQRLARVYTYTGAAWYQRSVEIPEHRRDKRIQLFLVRCVTLHSR